MPPLEVDDLSQPPAHLVGKLSDGPDLRAQMPEDGLELLGLKEPAPGRALLQEVNSRDVIVREQLGFHGQTEHPLQRGEISVDGAVAEALPLAPFDIAPDGWGRDAGRLQLTKDLAELLDGLPGLAD